MNKFIVGPAKTKGGKEVQVYAVHGHGSSYLHAAILMDNGRWSLQGFDKDGKCWDGLLGDGGDLLPNNPDYPVKKVEVEVDVCEEGFNWGAIKYSGGKLYPLIGKRCKVTIEVIE